MKANDLCYVDNDGQWLLEEGDFRAAVGDQHVQFVCTETTHVNR